MNSESLIPELRRIADALERIADALPQLFADTEKLPTVAPAANPYPSINDEVLGVLQTLARPSSLGDICVALDNLDSDASVFTVQGAIADLVRGGEIIQTQTASRHAIALYKAAGEI